MAMRIIRIIGTNLSVLLAGATRQGARSSLPTFESGKECGQGLRAAVPVVALIDLEGRIRMPTRWPRTRNHTQCQDLMSRQCIVVGRDNTPAPWQIWTSHALPVVKRACGETDLVRSGCWTEFGEGIAQELSCLRTRDRVSADGPTGGAILFPQPTARRWLNVRTIHG